MVNAAVNDQLRPFSKVTHSVKCVQAMRVFAATCFGASQENSFTIVCLFSHNTPLSSHPDHRGHTMTTTALHTTFMWPAASFCHNINVSQCDTFAIFLWRGAGVAVLQESGKQHRVSIGGGRL